MVLNLDYLVDLGHYAFGMLTQRGSNVGRAVCACKSVEILRRDSALLGPTHGTHAYLPLAFPSLSCGVRGQEASACLSGLGAVEIAVVFASPQVWACLRPE